MPVVTPLRGMGDGLVLRITPVVSVVGTRGVPNGGDGSIIRVLRDLHGTALVRISEPIVCGVCFRPDSGDPPFSAVRSSGNQVGILSDVRVVRSIVRVLGRRANLI